MKQYHAEMTRTTSSMVNHKTCHVTSSLLYFLCAVRTLNITHNRGRCCVDHYPLSFCRRVHISATTYSYLNGEFEVEPGYGEKRDESLRIAGLKTYFIVRVLKPVGSLDIESFKV